LNKSKKENASKRQTSAESARVLRNSIKSPAVLNPYRTSSVLGGSSQSNTIVNFGETTLPSAKTMRKESTLH